jgi:murein L,D-transpeptidase YafK
MPSLSRPLSSRQSRLRLILLLVAAGWVQIPVTAAGAEGVTAPASGQPDATPKADRVIVYKAQRRLELRRGDTLLRSYHIALGRQPAGQKIGEGDGRTPEGTYFIDQRKVISDYHLALHISYPDEFDIKRAAAAGVRPGGSIMIHGQPNGMAPADIKLLKKDWTAGCIALTDAEIDEVSRLVDDGTPIDIYP